MVLSWAITAYLVAMLPACAGKEFAPKRGVLYYHSELAAADRAVEAARAAGKNTECPEDFKSAEKMKNDAYDIYLSCRTAEGVAKANEAAAAANGLCGKKVKGHALQPSRPSGKVVDRVTLHINFDTDKADIRQTDVPELQKAIDFVKKYPNSKISVEGYTDDRGDDAYNLKLSERRAQAVKKYLEDNGHVKPGMITSVGKGKADPIGDNATEKGRFQNRRVEVIVVGDCGALSDSASCGAACPGERGRAAPFLRSQPGELSPVRRHRLAIVGRRFRCRPRYYPLVSRSTAPKPPPLRLTRFTPARSSVPHDQRRSNPPGL